MIEDKQQKKYVKQQQDNIQQGNQQNKNNLQKLENNLINNQICQPIIQAQTQQFQEEIQPVLQKQQSQSKDQENVGIYQIILSLLQQQLQTHSQNDEIKLLLQQLCQITQLSLKEQIQTNINLKLLIKLSHEPQRKSDLEKEIAEQIQNDKTDYSNPKQSPTSLQIQLYQSQNVQKQQQFQSQLQKEVIIIVHPGEHATAYLKFLTKQISDLKNDEHSELLKKLTIPLSAQEFQGQASIYKDKNLKLVLFFYHNQTRTDGTEGKLKQQIEELKTTLNIYDIKFAQISIVNIINSNTPFTNFDSINTERKITVQVISQTTHSGTAISKQSDPTVLKLMEFIKNQLQDK